MTRQYILAAIVGLIVITSVNVALLLQLLDFIAYNFFGPEAVPRPACPRVHFGRLILVDRHGAPFERFASATYH
jgi:hypothetical protein